MGRICDRRRREMDYELGHTADLKSRPEVEAEKMARLRRYQGDVEAGRPIQFVPQSEPLTPGMRILRRG